MSNKNVTKIERLSSGMVKLYNRSNVIGAFSALNSISIGYENNNARTIQFTDNGNTISFQVFNLQQIIGSTTSVTYDPIDTTSTGPEYNSRVFEVFDFLSSEVFQGFSPGPTFVGGVVAAYPNFASFPVTGTQSVIYIDEADNSAYYWDGTSYQLLVSTGVEQYANFASFPVTGSANVIYIDMSGPKPYVWNGTAYESIGGDVVWGGITGTLSDQTDLQAALDAKFNDPTGTTSQYIRGDGTLATFPAIPGGTVTSVGTTGLISGGPITGSGTITTSMATNKLVGRYSAGTGIMEEITIGSGLTLTGAGILNNTATPTPIGYYGAFQDNTRQTAAAINTPYAVRLNTTDLSDSITIVNNGSGDPTRITIANTGVYNIQFSLQLEKNGGSGNMTANIWLRKNGVDVPSTTGKVVLTGSASASPVIAAWNYVLDVVGGDYYELMWAVSNIHVEIFAQAATPPHPATPSAILTVTQQSGIMAGTGITAINSLTGAVQTLATGTSGTDFAISSTGTTHTFNLPTASATNRGALSSADWNTFNGKFNLPSLTNGSVLFSNGTTIAQDNANLFWDDTNNRLGIGTNAPPRKLSVTDSTFAISALFGGQNAAPSWVGIGCTDSGTSPIIQAYNNSLLNSSKLCLNPLGGNVLIGTTTDVASSKLTIESTTQGVLIPRMTTTQRDAITSPAVGLQIFNTTTSCVEYFDSFWGWMPVNANSQWYTTYGIDYFSDGIGSDDMIFNAASGTGAGVNSGANVLGKGQGTGTFITGTTSTGFAGCWTRSYYVLGGGRIVNEYGLTLAQLSVSADRYYGICGFWDVAGNPNQVDGVYFLYDNFGITSGSTATPNWQCVTSSNSVRTFTTTSVVVGSYAKLRIEVNDNATQVLFYINGTLVATHTTNIPSGTSRNAQWGSIVQKQVGTTSLQTFVMDYYAYRQKFTTPR